MEVGTPTIRIFFYLSPQFQNGILHGRARSEADVHSIVNISTRRNARFFFERFSSMVLLSTRHLWTFSRRCSVAKSPNPLDLEASVCTL